MKPQQFAALVVGLALMALILLLPGRPVPVVSQAEPPQPRTVTVLGQGEVRVKPDQATLYFGVTTWKEGASAAEAEALNAASVAQLQEALLGAGADAAAMVIHAPTVRPLTRQDALGRTLLTGYEVTTRVGVTLTNLQRVDGLVDAALAGGATELAEVTYGLRDAAETRQRALQAAVADARSRALALAQSQNRSLGDLVVVEVVAEEAPEAGSRSSPAALLYRVEVRGTFEY